MIWYISFRGICLSDNTVLHTSVLFQQHPVPAVLLDSQGYCLAVNDAFTVQFALSTDDAVGRPMSDVLAWEDWQGLYAGLKTMRKSQQEAAKPLTALIHRAENTVRTIEVTPLFLDDSVSMYLVLSDVSEQKRLQEEFAKQHELLHWIETNSSDFIAVIDDQGIVRYASASYQNIFGRAPELIVNHPALEYVHPDDLAFVQARLDESLTGYIWWFPTEFRYLHADGRWIYTDVRATPVYTSDGVRQITIFARDIQERKEQEALIQKMAYHDALTGLPNRHFLLERLEQVLHNREEGSCISLLFIDLDGFKTVNDTQGHTAGDCLLELVAKRLQKALKTHEYLARMGGDEFVILLDNAVTRDDAVHTARKVLDCVVSEPFAIDGTLVTLTTSIGMSCCPEDGSSVEELIRTADTALYKAKASGKNRYAWHS